MTHTPTLADRAPESGEPLPRWPDAVGEGPGFLRCAACGRPCEPGELLLVRDRWGVRPVAYVHRPSVSAAMCLAWAGRATRTSIEFYDAAAARQWDHAHAKGVSDITDRALRDALRSHRHHAEQFIDNRLEVSP